MDELTRVGTPAKSVRRTLIRTAAGIVGLSLTFCASVVASPTPKRDSVAHVKTKPHHHWFQIGEASWYGKSFEGKKTATGEPFNMYAFTCAHRTLPLGSWVRVTNLRNKKFEFLRVNDRGPVPQDRVIDLSYAAAKHIGISGLGKVRIEQIKPSDPQLAEAMITQIPLSATPAVVSR